MPSESPRDRVIEAMARAHDPVGWDWYDRNAKSKKEVTQSTRKVFHAHQIKCATAALDAMIAALPGVGMAVVPVEATRGMINKIIGRVPFQSNNLAVSFYTAMIAEAPNVLESSDGD